MEVLNPTIPIRPQFFSTVSIFSPNYSLTILRNKIPYRLSILSLNPPPFSTSFSLFAIRKLRISAHLGLSTNLRNSLRKKLTQQNSESYYSNLGNDSVEERNLNSNYGVNDGFVSSDSVEQSESESESKPLVDSVLRDKLGNWADQYETDSAFLGIGLCSIFTVFQDSEDNVKRVVVNEDEILRRSGIELELYKKSDEDARHCI